MSETRGDGKGGKRERSASFVNIGEVVGHAVIFVVVQHVVIWCYCLNYSVL